MDNIHERFFEQADEEFTESRNKALWTKSLALVDGDEDRARYAYLRLRAATLALEVEKRPHNERQQASPVEAGTAGIAETNEWAADVSGFAERVLNAGTPIVDAEPAKEITAAIPEGGLPAPKQLVEVPQPFEPVTAPPIGRVSRVRRGSVAHENLLGAYGAYAKATGVPCMSFADWLASRHFELEDKDQEPTKLEESGAEHGRYATDQVGASEPNSPDVEPDSGASNRQADEDFRFPQVAPALFHDATQKREVASSDVKPSRRKARQNFIARHWRGELSLGVAYWGVNVAVGIGSALLAPLLSALFITEQDYRPPSLFAFLLSFWTCMTAMWVWQIVGLWRSARSHAIAQAARNRTVFWARAAQAMVVLGVLSCVGMYMKSAVPQVRETYKMAFLNDPDIPDFTLELLAGGRVLSISGGIKYGLAASMARVLQSESGVQVLRLTSSGGRVGEAKKLFHLVRQYSLTTYVPVECDSACTLVFSAGGRRWLLNGARLGFHGGSFPGMSYIQMKQINDAWGALYTKAGISAAFVRKAMKIAPSEIWYPTNAELAKAGVITAIVPQD